MLTCNGGVSGGGKKKVRNVYGLLFLRCRTCDLLAKTSDGQKRGKESVIRARRQNGKTLRKAVLGKFTVNGPSA